VAKARDRGQRVTIVGVPADGLLALTGYGGGRPHLLGLITVLERDDGHCTYRVGGHAEDLPELDTAAAVRAAQRSASDGSAA
jgi:hypothetical protein